MLQYATSVYCEMLNSYLYVLLLWIVLSVVCLCDEQKPSMNEAIIKVADIFASTVCI